MTTYLTILKVAPREGDGPQDNRLIVAREDYDREDANAIMYIYRPGAEKLGEVPIQNFLKFSYNTMWINGNEEPIELDLPINPWQGQHVRMPREELRKRREEALAAEKEKGKASAKKR